LLEIDGFDVISTDNFLDTLPDFQAFYKIVKKIISVEAYTPANVGNSGGVFSGEVVVFTGFRNKNWQDFVESEGGRVSTSVSGNTTIVIYKDGDESSAKYLKAAKLGKKLIPM